MDLVKRRHKQSVYKYVYKICQVGHIVAAEGETNIFFLRTQIIFSPKTGNKLFFPKKSIAPGYSLNLSESENLQTETKEKYAIHIKEKTPTTRFRTRESLAGEHEAGLIFEILTSPF